MNDILVVCATRHEMYELHSEKLNLMESLGEEISKTFCIGNNGKIVTKNFDYRFVLKGNQSIGVMVDEVVYSGVKDRYYYECIVPCMKKI